MKRAAIAGILLLTLAGCSNAVQKQCKSACDSRYGPGREREACKIDCYWAHRSP